MTYEMVEHVDWRIMEAVHAAKGMDIDVKEAARERLKM
jgi:hypothetical protein